MTTFFTSDTHFFHRNIIGFCNRPYESVEDMNYKMIANWNLVVKPTDTIYFLGDFSFGKIPETEQVLYQLNGNKHLITGNHDRKGRCENLDWSKHFDSQHDYLRVHIENQKLILCHFPFSSWERGYINLHGHTHGTYQSKYMQHDVGVDVNNYTPISLEDAVKRALDKENKTLY